MVAIALPDELVPAHFLAPYAHASAKRRIPGEAWEGSFMQHFVLQDGSPFKGCLATRLLMAHNVSSTRRLRSLDLCAGIPESLPLCPFFREPAKRQRELRAFIAKQRRQAKQIESDNQNRGSDASEVKSDDDPGEDDDDDDDDNSVLTTAAPASPRSAPPALRFSADSRPASSAVPTALPDAVLLGARTLCFEVDEESKPSGGSVLTGGSTIERIENDVVPAVIETEDCSAGSNEHSPTKELKQGDGGDEAASTPHFERRWRVDHAVSSSEQRSPSKDRVVVEHFVAKEVQEVIRSVHSDESSSGASCGVLSRTLM